MPVYKDEKRGSWYCSFMYVDWDGSKKRKVKRGFALKREAAEWEHQYIQKMNMSCNMSFTSLTELYFEDISNRVKRTTFEGKKHVFETKLIPFFGKMKVCDITSAHVRKWQN